MREEIEYSKKLIEVVKEVVTENGTPKAKKTLSRVGELLEDEKIREIQSAVDEDAKMGHKSEHNSFFGYKTHIAMTEERIITGIEVTTGEAPDGEYLKKIAEQSKGNGIEVKEICGDTAYSSKDNLSYAEQNEIKIISKLHPVISNGNGQHREGFIFNKDADTYQCPAGELAVKKDMIKRKSGNKNETMRYFFDIEKCKQCPKKAGCYHDGAKTRTHNVTILSKQHKGQKEFQETEYFKERAKQRYKIEAKNAELKQAHGLSIADSKGIIAMRLQSYFTAFVVNVKRIVKLLEIETA